MDKYSDDHGELILEYAVAAMERHSSVDAEVLQHISILDQQLVGSGLYLEQWGERQTRFDFDRYRFRWDLFIHADQARDPGREPDAFTRARDQRHVWKYSQIGDQQLLERIDIARVAEAIEEVGDDQPIEIFKSWPELGGLSCLLRLFHEMYTFGEPVLVQLDGKEIVRLDADRQAQQVEEAWQVTGTWRPDKLAELLPDVESTDLYDEFGRMNLSVMPEHIPTHVLLSLGKDDYFPYRIQYLREQQDLLNVDPTAEPDFHEVMRMEFVSVCLDQKITDVRLEYQPGIASVDVTKRFLGKLGLPHAAYR